MTLTTETRLAVVRGRASEMSLGGDVTEDTASTLQLQCAWLVARYSMGVAHARVVAEVAFARRTQR